LLHLEWFSISTSTLFSYKWSEASTRRLSVRTTTAVLQFTNLLHPTALLLYLDYGIVGITCTDFLTTTFCGHLLEKHFGKIRTCKVSETALRCLHPTTRRFEIRSRILCEFEDQTDVARRARNTVRADPGTGVRSG
ncbi:unnamed protein product, partial [Scytosiphon promiscuus]